MKNAEMSPNSRACTSCCLVQPLSEFYRTREWHRRTCKTCDKKRQNARYATNPKYRASQKARRVANYDSDARRVRTLAEKYGVTVEWYQQKLEEQDGVCAICRLPETAVRKGRVRPLAVDHCHQTGANRKLLCSRCNTMLGLGREDPKIFLAAAEYVSPVDLQHER